MDHVEKLIRIVDRKMRIRFVAARINARILNAPLGVGGLELYRCARSVVAAVK
jgi:hypothetical protein